MTTTVVQVPQIQFPIEVTKTLVFSIKNQEDYDFITSNSLEDCLNSDLAAMLIGDLGLDIISIDGLRV